MTKVDCRRVMFEADFDAIPSNDEYPIDELYDELIDRNERIGHEVYEQAERLKELTVGQQMLIQLGTFDSQVNNGGITQFFWNCTESIFDVADWIEALDVPELQANYERALESLVDKKEQWLTLRTEWGKPQANPEWETFQQTYQLLDLGWFDDAYFDDYGYNERQEWVRHSKGLSYILLMQLAKYVRNHRSEFITE